MKYTEESLDELIKWIEHLDRIVGLKNSTLVDVFDTVAHAKEKLKNELMKITNENTHLERENEELDLFMKTPQMKELANKLGEIENIQIEIIDFLEKNGVIKIHQV